MLSPGCVLGEEETCSQPRVVGVSKDGAGREEEEGRERLLLGGF